MRRVNIGFKGMSFAQNDCAVEDGTLALMHNAKFENGEVVPVNNIAKYLKLIIRAREPGFIFSIIVSIAFSPSQTTITK